MKSIKWMAIYDTSRCEPMQIPKFRNSAIELLDDDKLAEKYSEVVNAVGLSDEAREFERVAARELDRRDAWDTVYPN